MPVRSRLLIAITVVSGVFGLSGCGSSGGDVTVAGRPYADANKICLDVAERFADLQKDPPRSFQQGEQLLTVLSQTAEDGARALGEVEPPALQALSFERYLKSRDRVGDLIERGVQAAKSERGEAYDSLRTKVEDGAEERRRLAERAGLHGCAAAEQG